MVNYRSITKTIKKILEILELDFGVFSIYHKLLKILKKIRIVFSVIYSKLPIVTVNYLKFP